MVTDKKTAIETLSISHFRSHKRLDLEIDGRSVALYGPNGAGKTNILEAVSMLSPGRGLRGAKAEALIRQPEAIGWRIKALIRGTSGHVEVMTSCSAEAKRRVEIDGKAASQLALGTHLPMVWLVPQMDRLWVEGAEGRRRFLDRIALSFAPGHAQESLRYEHAMRERNRMLKDQIQDAAWYEALEEQMAQAAARITATRLQTIAALELAQEAAQTAFPTALLSLSHAETDLAGVEAEALQERLAANRRRDMAAGRSLIGPHRADLVALYRSKNIAASAASTGEQKALLISLVLANGRALAAMTGAPPILLLDEVSAHLDKNRRRALYEELVALGVQCFMTGTGAELFEGLGGGALGLEVREAPGGSNIEMKEL